MRTTIELPDELYRRIKVKAAQGGLKMKDLIAHYVQEGLARDPVKMGATRPRSPLPVVRLATDRTLPVFSNQDLARVLEAEDVAAIACGDRAD